LPPADVIEHTVELCGDLKEELVSFVGRSRFSKQFKAALGKATTADGFLDQGAAITAASQARCREHRAIASSGENAREARWINW